MECCSPWFFDSLRASPCFPAVFDAALICPANSRATKKPRTRQWMEKRLEFEITDIATMTTELEVSMGSDLAANLIAQFQVVIRLISRRSS